MAASSGYQKLASFMVQEKYSLFREFQELACEDLLYRQSELVHLEKDLRLIVKHDRENGRDDEEKLYSLDWRRLSTSSQRGSPSKHWTKRLELRSKLREYYETLLQYKQIFAQSHPKEKEVSLLREWIARPDLGGGCGFIGRDLGPLHPTVYDEEFQDDLMVLIDRRGEDDALTRLLTGPILHAFDWVVRRFKHCKSDLEGQTASSRNLRRYSDSHILWVVELFGTVLASIAPMSSIVALYFIQDLSSRLGSVCVFTIAFAAIVKLATRARRVEVFAVTAAKFCSVQVVFVGSTTPYGKFDSSNK